jgi:hypothetical protein
MKKIKLFSLFLFHPPLHHLHYKYGAAKQAKHEKINVFRPVSEQNFIPEFVFCPPLKYFRSPILLSEQIVRK